MSASWHEPLSASRYITMPERLKTYGARVNYFSSRIAYTLQPTDGSVEYYDYYEDDPNFDEDDLHMPQVHEDGIDYTRHFILVSHTPFEDEQKGRRATKIYHGDVEISLTPEEEDTVVVPSEVLRASHPWWNASLDDRWSGNKTIVGSSVTRYELKFTSPRDSMLIGKAWPTAPEERESMYSDLTGLFGWEEYLEDFDETDSDLTRISCYCYVRATISAHRVGFALLCGHPLKPWRADQEHRSETSWTLIILRLLDWIHEYGCLDSVLSRLTDFVLLHADPGVAPFTYLRIECHLQSKDLYKISLAAAVCKYQDMVQRSRTTPKNSDWDLLQYLGEDKILARMVVHAHATYKDLINEVKDELDSFGLVIFDEHWSSNMTDQYKELRDLADQIFRSWWDKNRRFRHAQHNVYDTLVRGKLDVRSITGRWRASTNKWRSKLPRKTTFDDLVGYVQGYFDLAADVALRLYDEEMRYRGPDWRGQWQEASDLLVDEDYVYPWQEVDEYEPSRSNLTIAIGGPAHHTCIRRKPHVLQEEESQ